jgi:hypothetical protein
MPVLLEDRDKCVREEGKTMVIEIYRWIGDALKPQLNSLKPIQVSVFLYDENMNDFSYLEILLCNG